MAVKIMSHLVAYYPSKDDSLKVARALSDGGCDYLELQFPFSDPSADGAYIQAACDMALKSGFSLELGFKLVEEIQSFTSIPIFIMSYANLLFAYGMKKFLNKCRQYKIFGLIVPDLPVDYDEGLYSLGAEQGIHVVPVIPSTINDKRLDTVLKAGTDYIYVALRKGITGRFTQIGTANITFLRKEVFSHVRILAGFGIQDRKQVERLAPYVHAAIIGSAFIKEIEQKDEQEGIYQVVHRKMKELSNRG